jgi:predicted RNase H-like HicB family nuclease
MSRFTVVIHPQHGGGYWGEIPSLPGCCSSGNTIDELMDGLREMARGVVEVLQEEGHRPQEVHIAEVTL